MKIAFGPHTVPARHNDLCWTWSMNVGIDLRNPKGTHGKTQPEDTVLILMLGQQIPCGAVLALFFSWSIPWPEHHVRQGLCQGNSRLSVRGAFMSHGFPWPHYFCRLRLTGFQLNANPPPSFFLLRFAGPSMVEMRQSMPWTSHIFPATQLPIGGSERLMGVMVVVMVMLMSGWIQIVFQIQFPRMMVYALWYADVQSRWTRELGRPSSGSFDRKRLLITLRQNQCPRLNQDSLVCWIAVDL